MLPDPPVDAGGGRPSSEEGLTGRRRGGWRSRSRAPVAFCRRNRNLRSDEWSARNSGPRTLYRLLGRCSPDSWNITPNGHDAIMGPGQAAVEVRGPDGGLPPVQRGPEEARAERAGVERERAAHPGPLLHERVGDTIRVHFKNMDTLRHDPHSMHFHGVHYAPELGRRLPPGFSGPRCRRAAGADSYTYVLKGRRRFGRHLAVSRPLAVDDGLARGRHVRDALDPRPAQAGPGP